MRLEGEERDHTLLRLLAMTGMSRRKEIERCLHEQHGIPEGGSMQRLFERAVRAGWLVTARPKADVRGRSTELVRLSEAGAAEVRRRWGLEPVPAEWQRLAPRLFETLQQSRGGGSHLKALARLARVQLLIIDDFLLTRLSDVEQRDLLEVVEDRYQTGATIVASQCPIKDWHPNIGDPTLADAICDRLLHNAYKIEMRGDSMRTRKSTAKGRKEAIETNDKLS